MENELKAIWGRHSELQAKSTFTSASMALDNASAPFQRSCSLTSSSPMILHTTTQPLEMSQTVPSHVQTSQPLAPHQVPPVYQTVYGSNQPQYSLPTIQSSSPHIMASPLASPHNHYTAPHSALSLNHQEPHSYSQPLVQLPVTYQIAPDCQISSSAPTSSTQMSNMHTTNGQHLNTLPMPGLLSHNTQSHYRTY
jgi:hypothetical protein